MQCYHPIAAYQLASGDVVFEEKGDVVRTLSLSCGQCVGCLEKRASDWSVRCMHEASLYDRNCFITLTYRDEFLPAGGELSYLPFQLFLRRLRKQEGAFGLRFFMCGEYGSQGGRPHYHALLFNYDFPDKVFLRKSPAGLDLYRSGLLERLWQFGYSSIGNVTPASAAYVARYTTEKLRKGFVPGAVDESTGEITARPSAFNRMSLKPGIGRNWLRLYWPEVVSKGEVVIDGKALRAPKAYRRYLRDVDRFAVVQVDEAEAMRLKAADNTPERLRVKEEVAHARLRQVPRKLA